MRILKLSLFIAVLIPVTTGLACSSSQPVIELATVGKLSDLDNKAPTASPSPAGTLEPFTPPANAKYLHVSDGVILGLAIKKVQPLYPLEAQVKGVIGNVRVQITIDTDGNVVKAESLSGPPLLREAVLQAAKKWKYKPNVESWPWVFVVGKLEFKFPPQ